MKALVSVVIPCLNEEKYIRTCVESLLSNGYPAKKLEILVSDGRSTDQTRPILAELSKQYPNVRMLDNIDRSTPHAMNLGIQEAKGDYVMIAGAHSYYDQNYISECVKAMHDLNADVVGGMMRTEVKNETSTSLAIRRVLSHPIGVGNSKFRIGIDEAERVDTVPFGLYKRQMLLDLGAFNTRLKRNQDMELSKRLAAHGARIFLIPNVQCTYYARESWTSFSRNNYLNGLWNVRTVQVTGQLKSIGLRHMTPFIFMLSIVVPLLLSILHPAFALLSLLSMAAYFSLITIVSIGLRKEANMLSLFWTFTVLHFSYAWGSTLGILSLWKKP